MSQESNFNFVNTAGAIGAAALLTGNTKVAAIAGGAAAISKFVSNIRKAASGIEFGQIASSTVQAKWADGNKDWRVRLNIPSDAGIAYGTASDILRPLYETGLNALVFPYTPTVSMTHTANYNSLDVTHSNYPFLSYQNSKVEQITITGEFYCETSVDALYWLATVHFLRSVTKMAFGDSGGDTGQPPPVLKLNGYGDYVFNNVPVVVKSFTAELPNGVDYIPGKVSDSGGVGLIGYAPTKSTITIVLLPIYSRTQQRQFNLTDFVSGKYVTGDNRSTGFI